MILQKEITTRAQEWGVPPATVDKDYVLGHFLSAFAKAYQEQLIFKGGTCLRKCYIDNYRFSEDLDFTAADKDFVLEEQPLKELANEVQESIGIQLDVGTIKHLQFKDVPKGYQVNIKYWGANHSRNQRPLPPERWHTKIKLEISTDELILLDTPYREIFHPYSDTLGDHTTVACYSIAEIVSEKLRALKQRSYTAPRDFYDLYYLSKQLRKEDWEIIVPTFLKKMAHKGLEFHSFKDLIDDGKISNVKRAWKTSIAHQIQPDMNAEKIIDGVVQLIKRHLPNGQ